MEDREYFEIMLDGVTNDKFNAFMATQKDLLNIPKSIDGYGIISIKKGGKKPVNVTIIRAGTHADAMKWKQEREYCPDKYSSKIHLVRRKLNLQTTLRLKNLIKNQSYWWPWIAVAIISGLMIAHWALGWF